MTARGQAERRPRVVVLRGHHANPWDLRPWELLTDEFDVVALATGHNLYDLHDLGLSTSRVRSLRDLLPPGRLGDLATLAPGDRYLGLARHLAGADIVHSAEIRFWFSAQPARLKSRFGYRLALTVWETIPFGDAYRTFRERKNRATTLPAADVFLATTERARDALVLEGAPVDRIEICPPGIDVARFADAAAAERPAGHLIVSPGRLVWEKGHQDVIRALAALRHGLVPAPQAAIEARLLVVGSGPEEERLRRHAAELGIADRVEFRRAVPYEEMPGLYASASCMVLASLPIWSWEEQFGMVLVESMAAGLPVIASTSGAIPEVVGASALHFAPGDWLGLARALAEGPLARAPGERVAHDQERLRHFSVEAAADRLRHVYRRLLESPRGD